MYKRVRRLLSLMLVVSMMVTSVAPAVAMDNGADAGAGQYAEADDSVSQSADTGDTETVAGDSGDGTNSDEPSQEPASEPEDGSEDSNEEDIDQEEEDDSGVSGPKPGKDPEMGRTDGVYDPQPEDLEEVLDWIDRYAASDYAETEKPYWEHELDNQLVPESWECVFIEDDGYFGVSYYTLRPLYPDEEDGNGAGEITITTASVTVLLGDESFDLLDGVSATDEDGGDISSQITILDDDGFDVEALGKYMVAYAILDEDETIVTAVQRAVTVAETLPEVPAEEYPLLTVEDLYLVIDNFSEESGMGYYTYKAGAFLEGVAAYDAEASDVTELVEITSYGAFGEEPEEGDLLAIGEYTIQLAVIRDGETLVEGSRNITIGTGIMLLPAEAVYYAVRWFDWDSSLPIMTQSVLQESKTAPPEMSGRTGYEHIGWSLRRGSTEPLSEEELDELIGSVTQNLDFYAVYRPLRTKVITIEYRLLLKPDLAPDDPAQVTIPFVTPYIGEFPLEADWPVPVESPTVDGYTILDGKEIFNLNLADYSGDATECVYYVPSEGKVKFVYRLQDVEDSTKYEPITDDTKEGRAGDEITPDPKVYAGFKQPEFPTVTLREGENETVFLDYDRLHYGIYFDTNGGTYYPPFSAKYGENITDRLPVWDGEDGDFRRIGYTLVGWETTPAGDWNEGELPETMPATDVYAKAIWESVKEAKYTVRYWLEQIDPTDMTFEQEQALGLSRGYDFVGEFTVTGDVGEPPEIPTAEEDMTNIKWETDLFDHWSYYPPYNIVHADRNNDLTNERNENLEILADGSTVVNIYYDRRIHTFEFSLVDVDNEQDINTGINREPFPDSDGSTMDVRGTTYDDDNRFKITAKYGDYIQNQWPDHDPVNPNGGTFTSWYAPHRRGGGKISSARTHLVDELAWGYPEEPTAIYARYFAQTYAWELSSYMLPIDSPRFPEDLEVYEFNESRHRIGLTEKATGSPFSAQDITGFVWNFKIIDEDRVARTNNFYYTRDRFALVFHNGTNIVSVDESYPEDNVDLLIPYEKVMVGVHYEKPLAGYDEKYCPLTDDDAPDEYEGHTFAGWVTEDGELFDFETATMPAADLHLFAKWEKTYKEVKFIVDDEENPYHTESVLMFETVSEPKQPSKSGYEFVGWYLKKDPTQTDLKYVFDFPVDKDMKLYAHFVPKTGVKYTVEYYNRDTGKLIWADDSNSGAVGTRVYAYGFDKSQLDKFDLDGYFVDKYEKSIELVADEEENVIRFYYEQRDEVEYTVHYKHIETNETLLESETVTTSNNVETVHYAPIPGHWTATPEIVLPLAIEDNEVTFYYSTYLPVIYKVEHYLQKLGGGYPSRDELTAEFIEELSGTVATMAYAVSKEDIYTGFTPDLTNSKMSGVITTPAADGTGGLILAVYYWRNEYTVTYVSNGGSEVPSEKVPFGGLVNRPDDPTRAGHYFGGWYRDKELTEPWDFATDTMDDEDLTLYAKWDWDGQNYRITYNANDRGKGGPKYGEEIYPGETDILLTLSATGISALYKGWEFKGWDTNKDGNGVRYQPGEELLMDSNKTLWAQWEHNNKDFVSVTYIAGGGQGGDWDENLVPGEPYTVRTQQEAKVTHTSDWKFLNWVTRGDNPVDYMEGQEIEHLTDNLYLYAKWDYLGEKITISYDANRGEGSFAEQSNPGFQYTIRWHNDPEVGIRRNGHKFTGWNTEADGSGTTYLQGHFTEDFTKDVTLYAQWEHDGKTYVKVIYDANEGVGAESFQVVPGEDHVVLSNTVVGITRLGHDFQNWNREADGSGKSYVAGNTVTPLNDDITLHAQWKWDTKTYATLAYNANGGTGGDSVKVIPGETVSVLRMSEAGVDRLGHHFRGWNIEANGSGKAYAENEDIKVDVDTTLYAQWEWNKTTYATLTYDANGGTGSHTVGNIIPGETRPAIDPANATVKFTRYGFEFQGWNTQKDGKGVSYKIDELVKVDKDTTLYAQWKHDDKTYYKVYYMSNLGDGKNHIVDVIPGSEHTILELSDTGLASDKHEFKGWNTLATGAGIARNPGEKIVVTSAVILHGQWDPIYTYQVTYDPNGGQGTAQTAPALVAGQSDTVWTVAKAGFTRNGHSFAGWKDATGKTYMPGEPIVMDSDITLFAQWNWDNRTIVNITYHANGGTNGGTGPSLRPGEEDEILDPTDSSLNVTRLHHTFLGWTTNPDGTGTMYQPGQKVLLHDNMNLYAQWDWNGKYVYVTYNSHGGTDAGNIVMEENEEIQIPVIPGKQHTVLSADDCNFARRGHEFKGWGTDDVETPPVVYRPENVITVHADVDLYASWEYDGVTMVTITYDANGGVGTNEAEVVPGRSISLRNAIDHGITRNKYDFVGWGFSPDGDADIIPDNEPGKVAYYKTNNDVTLYAIWKVNDSARVEVKYFPNGAEKGAEYLDANSRPGDAYTILDPAKTPLEYSKYGFTFTGWTTNPNGSGVSYKEGTEITLTGEDINLYAQWKHDGKTYYQIFYMPNGGSGYALDNVVPGDSYTVRTGASATVTREGYVVAYWTDTDDNGVATDYAGGDVIVPTAHMRMYAQWVGSNVTYNVGYNANEGEGGMTDTGISPVGRYTIKNADQAKVTRDGYTLADWNTVSSGYGTTYEVGEKVILKGDMDLHAQWDYKEGHEFKVTYDSNGADGLPSEYDGGGYTLNQKHVVLGNDVVNFSYTNADFLYWTLDPEGSEPHYHATDEIGITKDITLYAQWEMIPQNRNITYHSNYGKGSVVPPAIYNPFDEVHIVKGIDFAGGDNAIPGLTFRNWNTEPNGSGKTYVPNEPLPPSGDITLYAQWDYDGFTTYRVTFMPNTAQGGLGAPKIEFHQPGGEAIDPATNGISHPDLVFAGWDTAMDGTGTRYTIDEAMYLSGATILFAQWQ